MAATPANDEPVGDGAAKGTFAGSSDTVSDASSSPPADDASAADVAVPRTDSAVPDGGHALTRLRPASPVLGWALLVAGILGLIASAMLTIERIELLIDPEASLSCNFNPIISCGSVMVTEQGRFFGFPNPILGLPAFALVITTAVLTIGRVRLPRWYWIGLTLGTALGWVFVHYLIFQSIYRIGALCPYCMVVWTITPLILVLALSRSLPDSKLGRSLREWTGVLLPVWYAIVILLIGVKFWDYWSTLF
ncbi:vitamin K epoxide reductase family protein [Gordonia zhaorongruii]|uniref:vitamin K epoxide reductase family protein n=1 Tax=Gordonia zhaorongruii TaxID=2597659 RepID=UPI0010460D3D|nr:vitamin K epoxide reductase family protein [Gordonia zhaorongruii]